MIVHHRIGLSRLSLIHPCPLRSDLVLQGDLLVFRHFLLILHWILGLNYINVLYFVGWLKYMYDPYISIYTI